MKNQNIIELKQERNRTIVIFGLALAAGLPMMNYFTDTIAAQVKGDMNPTILAMNGIGMAAVLFAWTIIGVKAGNFADKCVEKRRDLQKEIRTRATVGPLTDFIKNNPGSEKLLLREFRSNLKQLGTTKLDGLEKIQMQQYVRNIAAGLHR